MRTSLFDYGLPKSLIAQKPASPRDYCRLMVLNKKARLIRHDLFYHLDKYLKKGDVLILNNTKVIPARLSGKMVNAKDAKISPRAQEGRKIEILLLKPISRDTWQCLLGGKKRRVGLQIAISDKKSAIRGEVVKKLENGLWEIRFNQKGKKLHDLIFRLGEAPVPPYIKIKNQGSHKVGDRRSEFKIKNKLKIDYQTIFAKYEGSVAAPTAGLHFTKRLISKLKKKGIEIEYVTLHVGLGTFLPVKTEKIEEHKMHSEWFEMKKEVAKRLNQAKKEGRRIIAVGTTSLRTLESCAHEISNSKSQKTNKKSSISYALHPKSSNTNLFIYPGYKFKFVDGLITNFHLPKSTLLMLISALASRKFILKAYGEAIKKKYRFYSFGDGMLIL